MSWLLQWLLLLEHSGPTGELLRLSHQIDIAIVVSNKVIRRHSLVGKLALSPRGMSRFCSTRRKHRVLMMRSIIKVVFTCVIVILLMHPSIVLLLIIHHLVLLIL